MSPSPEYYWLNLPSIIVDDSDPTIQYYGTWNTASETDIQFAPFSRTPMFNTLHVSQTFSTGSFFYTFLGQGISVFATPVDNTSFTSVCFLDGKQLGFDANAAIPQFGQSRPVCQASGLKDHVVHTISVNVSVPPRPQDDANGTSNLSGFAFDYMLIQPPFGVSPWDNGTQDVLLSVLDMDTIETKNQPTLNFGIMLDEAAWQIADVNRGWEFDPENGFHTTTFGSQFNLTFTGTSLLWYGYSTLASGQASDATFSIDGGAPSPFQSQNGIAPSQAFLFKTPVLQYARHLLTVAHHGTNGTLPLTLQSLIVQKSVPTILVPNSTVVPSSAVSRLPTSLQSTKRGKPVDIHIVGGIAGGAAFLILIASAACILIWWGRRRKQSMLIGTDNTTVVRDPFLIATEETGRIRVTQKSREADSNPFMEQLPQDLPSTKWTRAMRRTPLSVTLPLIPGPSTAVIQQQEPPHSEVNPLIQLECQTLPTNTDSTNEQAIVQTETPLHPITSNLIVSDTPPREQGERAEDSGIRMASETSLPPLYTSY